MANVPHLPAQVTSIRLAPSAARVTAMSPTRTSRAIAGTAIHAGTEP